VKSQCASAQVTATDASVQALSVATENAQRLNLDVRFAAGDWFEAVPSLCFDVIASNPPYIAEEDHHLAALTHEPISALTAGIEGLDDLRTLIMNAPVALLPGGWLLLEHGHDQAEVVRELLQSAGFERVNSRTDLASIARCSGGQWPVER
jgi:release factor glutamine methyltransferase